MPLNATQVEAAAGWLQAMLVKDREVVELSEAKRKALKGVVPDEELPSVTSDGHNIAFLQELLAAATENARELATSEGEVSRLRQELKATQQALTAAETRFNRLQGRLRKLVEDSSEPAPILEPAAPVSIPDNRPRWNSQEPNGGQRIGY